MKTVEIQDFIKSEDYQNCLNYINNIVVEDVAKILRMKGEGELVDFGNNPSVLDYMLRYEVPFFDITMDVAIKKDDKIFIDIDSYTYGMNCQFKSLFLRKYWNENLKDDFVFFVWNNYIKGQHNNEFDIFEKEAKKIFDESETVYDFTKNFIYNRNYEFIKREDIIENFEELIKNNILINTYRVGEFYKMDDNFFYYETNCHTRRPEIVDASFYSKYYDKFQKCNAKFNYLPSLKFTPKIDCLKRMKGKFLSSQYKNEIMFVMQFLLLY